MSRTSLIVSKQQTSVASGLNLSDTPDLVAGERVQGSVIADVALFDGSGKFVAEKGNCWATNFRLIFKFYGVGELSVPMATIVRIEKSGFSGNYEELGLVCRDGNTHTFGFSPASKKLAVKVVSKHAFCSKVKSLFCFSHPVDTYTPTGWDLYTLKGELERMGLNMNNWRISSANQKYELCGTYPYQILVPSQVAEEQVYSIATARRKGRIPVLTWANGNNSFLLRAAQLNPVEDDMTGFFDVTRSKEDENLVKVVFGMSPNEGLNIVDLCNKSDFPSDVYTGFYSNCKFFFLGMPEESALRDSLNSLASTCANMERYSTSGAWLEAIEQTKWLDHVWMLLSTSNRLAIRLSMDNESVLLQSQSGDGLLTSVSALVQVFADPFYRTISGFCVLIEKEFSTFGHKFGTFTGKKEDDPFSATFLIFLDAVWQTVQIFPRSFEFTGSLVLAIAEAAHSCLFGSFLYSCEKERIAAKLDTKTCSAWGLILRDSLEFLNPIYREDPSALVLYLKNKNSLRLWSGFFLRHSCHAVVSKVCKMMQSACKKNIVKLELTALKMPFLPPGYLPSLTSVTEICLKDNRLSQFPLELASVSTLEKLSIESNQVAFVAPEFLDHFTKAVPGLKHINLNDNQLTELSNFFTRFRHLESLRLHDNLVSELPNLAGFSELTVLDIGGNCLTSIPEEVVGMQKLETLNVSASNLPALPAGLCHLPNLTSLNISQNNLTELPEDFTQLTSLYELDLSNNKLPAGIPECLFLFTKLRKLGLGASKIEELPEAISVLQDLTYLDLQANSLEDVTALLDLSKLRFLYLQNNKLSQVPLDISKLDGLIELHLQHNKLEHLTPGVGKLFNLRVLNVANNSIRDIPGTIGYLDKLRESNQFNFKNQSVKLRCPPAEIVSLGSAAIFTYLQSLLQGQENVYRMKVMVVGQENVGKTSLLRCISRLHESKKSKADGQAHVDKTLKKATGLDSVSTDGIDIGTLLFKTRFPGEEGKTTVRLSVWDFAGQELYYTTHQFFLSERAVYVLVWNLAKNEEDSRVEYWLRSIKSKAHNAPIVIVATHMDDPKCSKEYVQDTLAALETKYLPEYPNIQAIIPVSCKNQTGVNDVDLWLQSVVRTQPHMGEPQPKAFLELEKMAQQEAKRRVPPVCSWEDFARMGVINNIKTQEQLQVAAGFLHNLGTIVHFQKQKGLEDVVILDPQWLTDVMSTIITTKHQVCNKGVLNHSMLRQIWRPPHFPEELHPVLLSLLEKFEISYYLRSTRVGNDIYTGKSMVPSMLPEPRPAELDKLWGRFPKDNERQFTRRYEFGFIPHGFISRLMVRVLHFAEPTISWRFGMLVEKSTEGIDDESEHGDYQILLEAHPVRKVIDIIIRGSSDAKLVQIILETINALIDGWYSLNVRTLVPCIHCIRDKMYDPYVFPLETCEQAAIDGKSVVKCQDIRPIRLDELAPDVTMTHMSNCKLDYKELVVQQQIGEGGFALVYKGTYQKKVVAIKKIKFGEDTEASLSDMTELQAFGEFRREVWIMSGLIHMNCVQLAGFTMDPFCIVTEFMHHGNLYDLIQDKTKEMTWGYRWRCAMDIAKGMAFLHNTTPPVIHRDLKTPNVLLASLDERAEAVAKVADFGLSQALASTTQGRSVANPVWLAPEIMKNEEYTEKADVYSFGVMVWELATREDFFGECKFMSALENKVIEGERPAIPDDVPEEFADIIRRTWVNDPEERPGFNEVVEALAAGIKKHCPNLYDVATADKEVKAMKPKPKVDPDAAKKKERTEEEIEEEKRILEAQRKEAAAKEMDKISKRLSPKLDSSAQAMVYVAKGAGNQVWVGLSDGSISIWSDSGKYVESIAVHTSQIFSMFVAGPESIWVTSADKTMSIVNPKTNKKKKEVKGPLLLCLQRVGKTVWAGSSDALVYVFDKAGKQKKKFKVVENGPICSILPVEHQGLVWIGTDVPGKTIVRVNIKNGKVLDYMEGHSKKVTGLLEINGLIWSCSADKTLRVWSADNGECLKILQGHTGPIYGMLHSRGKVWTCSWDKSIILWDSEYQVFFKEYEAHDDAASCLTVVESTKSVWSGSWDQTLLDWHGGK